MTDLPFALNPLADDGSDSDDDLMPPPDLLMQQPNRYSHHPINHTSIPIMQQQRQHGEPSAPMIPDYDEPSSDDDVPNNLLIEMDPLLPPNPTRKNPASPGRQALEVEEPRSSTPIQIHKLFGSRPRGQQQQQTRASSILLGARVPRKVAFGGSFWQNNRDSTPNHETFPAITSDENRNEQAKLMWGSEPHMDQFLCQIYEYFQEKGFLSIILTRACNLLVLGFMIWFTTFLGHCIDYKLISKNTKLADVIYPQCVGRIHGVTAIFLFAFGIWWVWQFIRLGLEIPRLLKLKKFYEEALTIKEADMDTITWQEVVIKIIQLDDEIQSSNSAQRSRPRIDAHVIANRIMRKDNYLISIFNRDILDLSLPIPYFRQRQLLTKIIEWNLSFCIFSYVFDDEGVIRKRFLKATNKAKLVEGLKQRFAMMALLNAIFAPFLLIIMVLNFLFRYAEEYQRDPSLLGARQYTPLAQWKFREFNELPHVFQRRLNLSYPKATKYLNQFPKRKIIVLARFISFIAGSIAASLALISIIDQELLLGFEITPGGSVLFYISVFGGILAASRGMVPDENVVFDPERVLREVIEDTHYLPDSWREKMHTEEVKGQFAILFDFKILLFLQEIISVLYAPFILYYSLPKCSDEIVDFFREFTVHSEAVGFICSFADFNLRANGNPMYGAPASPSNENRISKDGKLERSLLFFKANHPAWEPREDGTQYIQHIGRLPHRLGQSVASRSPVLDHQTLRRVPRIQMDPVNQSLAESVYGQSVVAENTTGLFGLFDAMYLAQQKGFATSF